MLNITHISECPSTPHSGMGRIQYNWNKELESRGHKVLSIGPSDVAPVRHPALFPLKAWAYYKEKARQTDIILAHEPVSGIFVNQRQPVVLVSHGIEPRNWELSLQNKIPNPNAHSFRTRLLFPLWRLYWCERGIRGASKLLLSNSEDADFVQVRYKRKASDILIFKNGYYPALIPNQGQEEPEVPTLLWNSAWIDRKGKEIFVKALHLLLTKGLSFKVLITGTGYGEEIVWPDIPDDLKPITKIVSRFDLEEEKELIKQSSIFVLASYFEGLPLSLVQAMASGLCCVASRNCGQKDIIQHGETGLLFETGNENDLAIQLEKVIQDKNLRKRLSASANLSMQPCTWEKVSEEVANFILSTK